MASIVERVIGSETDKRLVLTGEQAGRTISIGTNWSSIRLGLRFSVDTTGFLTLPHFYFGMCAGTSSLPGDVGTQHFIGTGPVQNLLVASNNSTNYIRTASGQHTRRFHIQNGSIDVSTTGAASGTSYYLHKSAGAWGAMFIEITKGSPNFTVVGSHYAGTGSITLDTFNGSMATGFGGTGVVATCNVSSAVDEATYGYLDTVAVSWGHATIPLEVSDIAFARLS